jgi:hypothetical protein
MGQPSRHQPGARAPHLPATHQGHSSDVMSYWASASGASAVGAVGPSSIAVTWEACGAAQQQYRHARLGRSAAVAEGARERAAAGSVAAPTRGGQARGRDGSDVWPLGAIERTSPPRRRLSPARVPPTARESVCL